ncbi:MAG: hypothetical protein NKF70_13155 [Methanobacterium sp. ERen5]|nr:MAG: hypothetical protein NKF70_13155 [Methanobacterium sp. ERen5]
MRYYPNIWKLGFMYHEFSDERITFTLYPIEYNQNDFQIKKIDNINNFMKKGLGVTLLSRNPIKTNPKSIALKNFKPKIDKILKMKGLLIRNTFLANEFAYAFANRFSNQLGLSEENKYSIKEINSALLNNNNNIGNNELPISQFFECLQFLEENGNEYIKNAYTSKDYSRFASNSWIWNTLTPIEVMNNLKIFLDNLSSANKDIFSVNFPELNSELNVLADVSRLIVIANLSNKYEKYEDSPSLNLYYLISPEKEDLKIDLYLNDDVNIPEIISKNLRNENFDEIRNGFKEGFILDNHHYKFKLIRRMVLDFIYNDTPLLDFIQDDLKGEFNNFFNK